MINFCTLFDSNYLSRGLAMYQSLADTRDDFHLYIFCFDEKTFSVLGQMALPYVTLISLKDFETADLLRIKKERDRAEYCWTCTPHAISYALETFRLPSVTYVDADLYFYAKPSILLDEFERSGCSILLTGHNFSPRYSHLAIAGVYCVQFMCFKADTPGMKALRWWQERCTEWCCNRVEDGKFGDQKYLDDWLERFEGVYVLQHPGGGVAPWNVQQYAVSGGPADLNAVPLSGGPSFPVIFYHFHDLRLYIGGGVEMGNYLLDASVRQSLYMPYLERLKAAGKRVQAIDASFDPHGRKSMAGGVRKTLGRFLRRLRGNYIHWDMMEGRDGAFAEVKKVS